MIITLSHYGSQRLFLSKPASVAYGLTLAGTKALSNAEISS